MQDKTIRRVLAFTLLIAAVLVVVAIQAVRNINRSVATSDWVNHTHSVILETEEVRSALYVADGALHTYALTGDARDLGACREAMANVTEHLEIISALTRQEAAQHEQVGQMESFVNQYAGFSQEILAARQSGNMDAVRALLAANSGGSANREVQRRLERLKNEELGLLTERDKASYLQAQATRWTVWSGVLLDVALLGAVAWLIRDDLMARMRAAAALTEANERLEARVRERTAELASANARLSAENLERQWANLALEHQLRYNGLIIDSISDLVFVLTKAQNVSRINPAVVHATGLEPAAIINQPLARVVRLEIARQGAAAEGPDPLARALREGRDLRAQPAFIVDKLGRQTPVQLTLFPLRDRDKVVGGVVTLQVSPPGAQPNP